MPSVGQEISMLLCGREVRGMYKGEEEAAYGLCGGVKSF